MAKLKELPLGKWFEYQKAVYRKGEKGYNGYYMIYGVDKGNPNSYRYGRLHEDEEVTAVEVDDATRVRALIKENALIEENIRASFVTTVSAVQSTGLTRMTLQRKARSGVVRYIKRHGRTYYLKEDIESLQKTEPKEPKIIMFTIYNSRN